ncbi:MAG: redoxin family protein, partial [Gammaproteobacteria bacterium]|nr:redoxin family protein [Gammaproteobacteria bacterium]
MRRNFLPIFLFSAFIASSFSAEAVPVENFVLLDHQGNAHELYYQSDAKAVVIMVQGNGCSTAQNAPTDFKNLRDRYASQGVRFFMINSNLADDRTSIQKEAEVWSIDIPILDDDTQIIGESLGLTRTAEVLLLDPKNWEIIYRGAMDDRYDANVQSDRHKAEATEHYLANALDMVLTGGKVEVGQRNNAGCPIDFALANQQHANISYSKTIAPLLKENCAHCHSPGGIGPWAMTEYTMIRGFAPMIREVVRTKRMPPWHADPHIGQWQGDRSLSIEEIQTLVHWIEAGAPRGDGPDPLESVKRASSKWPMGEPDLVLDIPGFEVPATGVVNYQFPYLKNPLDHGIWIKATTILPGDRSVVHHVLAGSTESNELPGREDNLFENYIIGYAPGAESYVMPEGTGVYVPPGGYYLFQLHYTPTGKAVVDESKMGLYFADEKPENFLRHNAAINPAIKIPAHSKNHEEVSYFEFYEDATLYTVFPHSHYRGKSSTFEVLYPDGRLETILSVPNYNFNWQRGYDFVEPMLLPA